MDQCYEDGSEIHVGDEVSYHGWRGQIVIVVDRGEYAPTFPKGEWPLTSMMMIKTTAAIP